MYKLRTRRIKIYNKELEEHVKIRTQQLETSNKELEAFAYSVSHDLRTPLRGINGYTKILLDDFNKELSEEARQYFNKIIRSANRMGDLIDSLLKLSRILRSEMKIEKVDLSNIAKEVYEDLKSAYPDRNVSCIIQPNLFVMADISLIKTVIANLIQNAWKFTEYTEGAKIEFNSITSNGGKVFFVKDNGVGYNMEYADKLFIPFSRLHSDTEFDGLGIGLASAKRIIDKHGGKIWAESKINEGATFFFTLA